MNIKKKNPLSQLSKSMHFRSIFIVFMITLLVACHEEEHPPIVSKANVIIPDSQFSKCIEKTGIADLEAITSLNCDGLSIKDIHGISLLKNLQTINLANNQINDLEPLIYLTKIQQKIKTGGKLDYIDLSNNRIFSTAKLVELDEYVSVILNGNPLLELVQPAYILAAQGDEQNVIRWSNVVGAQSYNLYFRVAGDASAPFEQIKHLTQSRFVHESRDNGLSYEYQVTAVYPQGEGLVSSSVTATPRAAEEAPSSPVFQYIKASEDNILLDWKDIDDVTAYHLYFSNNENIDITTSEKLENVVPPFNHRPVNPQTPYNYLLVAENSQGQTQSEAVMVATPVIKQKAAAEPLTASAEDNSLILSWNTPVGATNVHVFYGTNADVSIENGIELANIQSPFTHPGLSNEFTIYYLLVYDTADGERIEQRASGQPKFKVTDLIIDDAGLMQCLNDSGYQYIQQVQVLRCEGYNIQSLVGIEKLTEIRKLELPHNRISDLSPVALLPHLEELNLLDNRLSDLDAVSDMKQLHTLQVQKNNITQINGISQLTELRHLGLNDNQVSNLEPLAQMSQLERLQLANNNIVDVTSLSALENLTHLDLKYNQVQEIAALGNLNQLVYLDLGHNYVENFAPVLKLLLLTYLNQTENGKPVNTNAAPVASAGEDQLITNENSLVSLDGSGSTDSDGDALTFNWQFVKTPENSQAEIVNDQTVSASFYVDTIGEYQVQLTVNDGQASASDNVTIKFDNEGTVDNVGPRANAGPDQTLKVGDIAVLDAGQSIDNNGDILSYQWIIDSQPNASSSEIGQADQVRASWLIDTPGEFVAGLTVTDPQQQNAKDQVIISTINSAPVALTNDDVAAELDQTIILDGSDSWDVDGDSLVYQWSILAKPNNSNAVLNNPESVVPSLEIDVEGDYSLQLIVNDGEFDSVPDTVRISTNNLPPVANAGNDQAVTLGDSVILDGFDSKDANNDSLTYRWSLISKPDTSESIMDHAESSSASIEIDVEGNYIAQLIVNDGLLDSKADTVFVSTTNTRPVAAIDEIPSMESGEIVTLNSSSSTDSDGDQLNYHWSILSSPAKVNELLSVSNEATTSFIPLLDGDYVLQLLVNDSELLSAASNALISVDIGLDSDGDGLSDKAEQVLGTDVNLSDTDEDNISDGDEIRLHGTDPNLADTDGDGLSDDEEITTYHTNPVEEDTDKDGWTDYLEIEAKTDPVLKTSAPMATVMSMPQDITVLRTGYTAIELNSLNTIMASFDNTNVLRTGSGGAGELLLNTIVAKPDNTNILRTGEGQSGELLFNTIIANPNDISILRTGEGDTTNLQLNTIVADPKDTGITWSQSGP